jgi:PAS domain S-box-containing protein
LRNSQTILERSTAAACGLCLSIAGPAALTAQTDTFEESWRWALFTTASGLPSDRVLDIVETHDGVVWAATDAGAAWFDGFQWHPVEPPGGGPAVGPTSLQTDGRGGVWMVTRSMLFRGDTSGFQHHPVNVGGVEQRVREAVPFGTDSVLLVAGDPLQPPILYLYRAGATEVFDTPSPLFVEPVRTLWVTHPGRVWLNAQGGLFYWVGDGWHLKQAASSGEFHLGPLAAGPDGSGAALIWYPRELRGLWEWSAEGGPIRNPAEGQFRIESMDIGPSGEMLTLYETGDVRVRRGITWSSLDPVPEMRNVQFLEFRRNGDLWMGTRRGLFLHHGSSGRWTFRGYDFPDSRNSVNELMRARDGTVWMGTAGGLGIRGTDLTIEWVHDINGNRLGGVTGLAQDSAGNVWVSSGADFAGAYRWDGATWRHFGPAEGLDAAAVHRVATDRRGRVWFLGLSDTSATTGPGAFVFEDGVFTRWGEEEGLASGRVYAFAEGNDGGLWFGTAAGLSRWRNGDWTHWNAQNGMRGSRVFTLAVGDDGRVWFGDMNNGVGYVTEQDEVGYLTEADGLASDEVWDLDFDSMGRLWIAARGGLSSYHNGTFANWGQALGLSNVNLWPVLPVEDSVYVGTLGNGVAILSLSDADLPSHRLLVNPPVVADRSVLARWTALSHWGLVPSANIETRYRVDEGAWSPWSRVHSATFPDMPSGTHSLEVQAKCPLGVCASGSRTVAFAVPLPLLLQPVVAVPGAVLMLALLGLGSVAVRRKRVNDIALRESEQRFRALVEHAPEAIVIFDADTDRFIDANDKALTMFGLSRKQVLTRGPTDISAPLQPGGRPMVMAVQEDVRRALSGESLVMSWLVCGATGEEIPCEVRLVRIPSGERRLLRATLVDIREREGIEIARRQAEEKFAKAFHSSPNSITITSLPEGRFVDVNESFVEMSGYRRDEVIGRTAEELGIWARAEDRERMVQALQESDRVREFETQFEVRGGILDVLLSGEVIDLGGKPHLLAVAVNVTERKLARERLEESEARSRAFSAAAFDGICITEKGVVLDANDRLAEMLGCKREELVGKSVADFVAPESREVVAAKQRSGFEGPYEHLARRIDGSVFPVEVRAKAMRYQGRTVRFSVLHDLTERKRIEEEIREREAYFRSLIENVDDVITVIDQNGNVQYNSPSAERLTGFTAEKVVVRSNPR